LFEIFAELGEVGEVSLVRDDEGKNRGFGFITMRSQDVADRAIEALDGVDMRGRKLTVRASNN
jgi:RNA recognition motif-containing protein